MAVEDAKRPPDLLLHTIASTARMALASSREHEYWDRSMIPGGRPESNSTLPERYPWIS